MIVAVSQAKVGMIVSANILDRMGRMIVPSGTNLSDKQVRALKVWGVSTIEIVDENEPTNSVAIEGSAQFRDAQTQAEEIFRHAGQDFQFIETLKRSCVLEISELMARSK